MYHNGKEFLSSCFFCLTTSVSVSELKYHPLWSIRIHVEKIPDYQGLTVSLLMTTHEDQDQTAQDMQSDL